MNSSTVDSRPSGPEYSDAWSQYWKHGSLTTFYGGEFEVGYSGEVAEFWESCFSALPKRSSIVDLATGNGAIPFIAARISDQQDKDFDIVGVDYADIRLPDDPKIRAQMENVSLLSNRSMEATGIEPASIDLISSQYGFEYGQQDQALDEIDRMLRSNGQLALVLHHPDSAVVKQAKREYQQTRMCINEERLDRKVRDLVKVIGDARTPEQRSKLKFNQEAEKRREQINRTMGRILRRVQGEDDSHVHQVAQSFLRVFADLNSQSKQAKLDFIAKSSAEFLAYAGRMESMSAATLSEDGFSALITELERRGFKLIKDQLLRSPDNQLIARSLLCQK